MLKTLKKNSKPFIHQMIGKVISFKIPQQYDNLCAQISKTKPSQSFSNIPHEDMSTWMQKFWRLMRQLQHHVHQVYSLLRRLIQNRDSHKLTVETNQSGHEITLKSFFTKYQSGHEITLICQIIFYSFICWKLDGNMTDTSQSRYKTTV